VGGALYNKLGWHAPCIFCIGVCVFDLIARLLVLEKEPQSWRKKDTMDKDLSPIKVITTLLCSRRGMTGTMIVFVYGLVMGAKDVGYVNLYELSLAYSLIA